MTTATVKFTGTLSSKRFNDARNMVKTLGGKYDADTKTWTVDLDPETYSGVQPFRFADSDLDSLVCAYGATVERSSEVAA